MLRISSHSIRDDYLNKRISRHQTMSHISSGGIYSSKECSTTSRLISLVYSGKRLSASKSNYVLQHIWRRQCYKRTQIAECRQFNLVMMHNGSNNIKDYRQEILSFVLLHMQYEMHLIALLPHMLDSQTDQLMPELSKRLF